MKSCSFHRIANLDSLHRPAEGKPWGGIVLLHGYGANFADLVSLADVLDPDFAYNWYFPNAPLPLAIAPGYTGQAWFPIDMMALEIAMRTGERIPFARQNPAGLQEAAEQLGAYLSELRSECPKWIVGGFSQGSMVSCEYALHSATPPDALVLLSSNTVGRQRWSEALSKAGPMRIFQSHGQFDNVLPIAGAQDLKDLFESAGRTVESHVFPGGHEIPMTVLVKLKEFLNSLSA